VAEVSDVKKIVKPVLSNDENTDIIYVPFTKSGFELGGSSFAQTFGMLGMTPPDISDPEYFKKSFEAIQNLLNEGLIIAGHDISSGGLITALLEMNFSNLKGGLDIDLTELCEKDLIRLLFSEKPAVIIQVKKDQEVLSLLKSSGIVAFKIGKYVSLREVRIQNWGTVHHFDIDSLRDIWFKTSYLFDRNQTKPMFALARYRNYKKQPLIFNFSDIFLAKFSQFGIKPKEMGGKKIKAAIIREKGVNGDREMAWALHLAGFEVKDIHTTDLIKGTEGLEEINFIVFVGGFSNSDVFGSGKGWAGALLYNDKANTAIRNFYSRADTLSLGICNGCQVMTELGLIYPDHKEHPKMKNNDSGKFESAFLTVDILPNNSVMLKSLTGSRLGIWLANGEGRFHFPQDESNYCIPIKYSYQKYPGNPNGSPFGAAGIVSYDGRHLAMMPHIERAIFPWQWPYYPEKRKTDQVSPWFEAFVNAREWLTEKLKA
ncbi:MAG: phosphoribosylformylglycinamidine synthase subunit PurQ, partial [Bacteroidales bacterium]